MKKVMVLTGKQGGYNAMLPMLTEIHKREGTELQLVVVDQHLSKKFGYTMSGIGLPVYKSLYPFYTHTDTKVHRAANLGVYASGIADILGRAEPDIILLYGDRGEVAAAAIAAVQMDVPIAHLQAGDITGSVDNVFRGMITKAANILFCSNKDTSDNLVRQGESINRIFICGDQHIDALVHEDRVDGKMVCAYVRKESGKFLHSELETIILIYNPDTYAENNDELLKECIVKAAGKVQQLVAIYPCSDPGHNKIIEILEYYNTNLENFILCKSLPGPIFHTLLKNAALIIGNSSAGIIEAPFLGTPSIDIGDRQKGRLRGAGVYRRSEFEDFSLTIDIALEHSGKFDKLYGHGYAYTEILGILTELLYTEDCALLSPKTGE